MKTFMCVQNSPEWWELRRGVPTASNFDRIITPKTGALSKSADALICELIADSRRGCMPEEGPISRPMQNGIDTEPEARRWYEMEKGIDVRRVGFCLTDDDRFGCSPDALVGEDGGLELKCPELKTQAAYLLAGELPAEYRPQVHGCLIVTGRAWWDFLSYAPGLPPLLIRVTPDAYTDALRKALDDFWAKLEAAKAKIAAMEAA